MHVSPSKGQSWSSNQKWWCVLSPHNCSFNNSQCSFHPRLMLFGCCYACDCGWTFRLWNTSLNTSLTLICCTAVQATIHICIASDHFIHLMHQRLRSNRIIASAVKADVICVTSMPQVIFIQMVRGHRNPITCNEARLFFEARHAWPRNDHAVWSWTLMPWVHLCHQRLSAMAYIGSMVTAVQIHVRCNDIYMRLPIYELCKKTLHVFVWQCLSLISYIWCMDTAIWLQVWCSYVS
jgi:hypothetical protein